MHRVTHIKKQSKFDQEALSIAIEKWQQESPESKFFFRQYKENTPEAAPLLFCYQALWQRELLRRYGNNICLLDATYKTTKYCLPLFLLVVKTNIN